MKLKSTTVYFTTQESEATRLIEKIKENSDGDVIKQEIKTKKHGDYGEYYETTVTEEFTTSKSVLENGY